MFDPYKIRSDFPILNSKMNGKPLVYLDNGASSQKPKQVIEIERKFYELEYSNIHRGNYSLSQKATERFEKTRIKISNFFKAQCAKSIIFTSGTTESINMIAQTWGRIHIQEGDEILLSVGEHHSNLVPWQMLAQWKCAKLRFIPLDQNFQYDISDLNNLVNERTKLVAISQMSNVTGSIYNVDPIIKRAHSVGAKVLLDGAQGASHTPIDLRKLDVDFYALSAHKMLGPTGVGILFGKEEILESIPPWKGGGDMIESVSLESSVYAPLPAKLEAGTPNIAGVLGFSSAIDYLSSIGLENIHQHEMNLMDYALEKIKDIPGIQTYTTQDRECRGGVLSFNMDGIHPSDVGAILDEEGVAIRVGHHCCQPFMKYLNVPGTCRASFYLYNTHEDIDILADSLRKVHKLFSKYAKV